MSRVAALYVQTDGAYFGLPDVDPWDESRDARLYDGPFPVVAHPPCARWSRLAGFTEARFGLRRRDDGGCFAAALASVRKWGGVLEHPAYSDAWNAFDLPKPQHRGGWTRDLFDDGASCYVEQGRYGLPVKKATWLYAIHCELPELRWGYTPDGEGDVPNGPHGGLDTWRDSWQPKDGAKPIRGYFKTHRHDGMRSRTPEAFRDELLAMARSVQLKDAA